MTGYNRSWFHGCSLHEPTDQPHTMPFLARNASFQAEDQGVVRIADGWARLKAGWRFRSVRSSVVDTVITRVQYVGKASKQESSDARQPNHM